MTLPIRTRLASKRVWVAGHTGMVGGALLRRLAGEACEIVTADRATLDLTRQADVEDWLAEQRPDIVFLAAGRVGGILANDRAPAAFLTDNLLIAASVLPAAHRLGVEKLLYLGSSCLYPRDAAQPMAEDALMTGPLEPTNAPYAIAKIAGIALCQAYRRQHGADFVAALPTNLYGPGDNFHADSAHVPAALLRRCHEAKQAGAPTVTVWGSGRPVRDFLWVDDLADACVFLMQRYSDGAPINVGTGRGVTIADFAARIAAAVGYAGTLRFDPSRPDGAPRKVLDTSRLSAAGWTAPTGLEDGLRRYHAWFLANRDRLRSTAPPAQATRAS